MTHFKTEPQYHLFICKPGVLPKIKVLFVPKQLPAQLTEQDIHRMNYFATRKLTVEHFPMQNTVGHSSVAGQDCT
jgi:hypothetical protein